jgi:hypothetical protein
MNSLDNILAGGEAVPEGKTEEVEVTQAVAESPPEPEAEAAPEEKQGQKMVPHEALHAEKQKVKRYTEEVAEFRKQIEESNAAWERRVASILEAQKPKEPPAPPPDWFENPTEATRHQIAQQVSPGFDQVNQALMAQAQMLAGIKYGDDKVQEAEQAFMSAYKSGKLDPSDFQSVSASPNRYAAAVQWHEKQIEREIFDKEVKAAGGWSKYKAQFEEQLREKFLSEPLNGGDGQQAQPRPAAVMPTNLAGARNTGTRSGPAYAGSQSIADIFNR